MNSLVETCNSGNVTPSQSSQQIPSYEAHCYSPIMSLAKSLQYQDRTSRPRSCHQKSFPSSQNQHAGSHLPYNLHSRNEADDASSHSSFKSDWIPIPGVTNEPEKNVILGKYIHPKPSTPQGWTSLFSLSAIFPGLASAEESLASRLLHYRF